MSPGDPISTAAAAIKQALTAEVVDPTSTIESDRRAWIEAVSGLPLAAGAEESVEEIAGVSCRWVSPVRGHSVAIIVYSHGGGLTAGSSVTHREFASRLALATESRVLLVDYRLLPEHGITEPIADVVSVYRELIAGGETSAPIMFGGDSSGAALMVSALVALRDTGGPLPAGLISFSGAFDATLSSPSMDERRDPQLNRVALEQWQEVIRKAVDLDDARVSPIYGALHHLPPMLLVAGGDEVWRDDSIRLAERLEASGGLVELDIADGMWHVWPMSGSFPEADTALERAAAFIRSVCR